MKQLSYLATRFFVAVFLLSVGYSSKGQYVTIPDADFVIYLQNTFPYCMQGNQMDITCPDIIQAQSLYCSDANIHDITGIEYFTNVVFLDCSGNNIDTIYNLPPNLATLQCAGQNTGQTRFSILNIPPSLIWLDCSSNNFDGHSVPPVPNTLQYLNISNAYNENIYLPDSLQVLIDSASLTSYISGNAPNLWYMNIGYNDFWDSTSFNSGFFDNLHSLRYLNCNSSGLANLPASVYNITTLDTLYIGSANTFTNLPALPPNLQTLDCTGDMIASLPQLPSTLLSLYCGFNVLDSLPQLNTGLQVLDCSSNQISVLPALPSTLKILNCAYNTSLYYQQSLISLPVPDNSLVQLECEGNAITALPVLPQNLTYLDCSQNLLTALPQPGPALTYLDCSVNPVNALPVLPSGLTYLDCDSTLITALPVLPAHLSSLFASGIDSLTTITGLPSSMFQFNASNDKALTTITSLPRYIYILNLNHDMAISSLPALPDTTWWQLSLQNDSNLSCLPELKLINTLIFTGTAISCLPDYGDVYGYSIPALASIPLCNMANPSGCAAYWNVSGQSFFDSDSNCIYNGADTTEQNLKMQLWRNGNLLQQTFTSAGGLYSFFDTTSATYIVALDTANLPFTVICPASDTSVALINNPTDQSGNHNFACKCKPGFDLKANSIAATRFNPVRLTQVNISAGDAANFYGISCAHGVSGAVTLICSGPVKYVSTQGNMAPSYVSNDTIIWNIADFGTVSFFHDFALTLKTDSTARAGDQICLTLKVSPSSGDYDSSNNTLQQCYTVVTSFDPNYKEVYPVVVPSDTPIWLNYTIHFQNTGTAPAYNIYVDDTIDIAHLAISTFTLLAYSAQPSVQIMPGGIVRFNFQNINLPDSFASSAGSKGYVQYRVKTLSAFNPTGTIHNTAYIYFDLNPAVATNTVVDSVAACHDTINLFSGLCAGDSVYFYGRYIKQVGSYDTTLTGGCDTFVTLTLVVQDPLPPTYLYDTICANDSVLFNGIYIDTAGNYTAHYSGSACDSTVVLRLTVNALPVVSFTWDSLVAAGDVGWYNSSDSNIVAWCGYDSVQQQGGPGPYIFQLAGGNPLGGVWSGRGVINDSLNPGMAGEFMDTIVYSYTNSGACTGRASGIIIINPCMGINQLTDNSSISLYPNPATNTLFIKTENIQPVSTTVYDADGRLIYAMPFKPEIDINALSSGVYFVEVKSNEGVARKRFVKM